MANTFEAQTAATTAAHPEEDARELVSVLNHLVSICKDGEYGFRSAAADVKTPACINLFVTYSQQRAEFARELQKIVLGLGFEAETEGSFVGLLHREWIDVKAAVKGSRTVDAVLDECMRGEQHALRAYAEAVRHPLDASTMAVVQRQRASIETAHENIRSLRALCQRSD